MKHYLGDKNIGMTADTEPPDIQKETYPKYLIGYVTVYSFCAVVGSIGNFLVQILLIFSCCIIIADKFFVAGYSDHTMYQKVGQHPEHVRSEPGHIGFHGFNHRDAVEYFRSA